MEQVAQQEAVSERPEGREKLFRIARRRDLPGVLAPPELESPNRPHWDVPVLGAAGILTLA